MDVFNSFSLLPGCCIVCSAMTGRLTDICGACESGLPSTRNACTLCALPVTAGAEVCGDCLRHSPPQQRTRAAFVYTFPVNALIQRFKFNGDQPAGRVLAELFARRLAPGTVPDCLLPVPLHRNRWRERGFNQSEILANALGEAFGIPVLRDAVARVRETAVQSGMAAAARRHNVRGAFAVRAGLPAHAAIIDDVLTTGSTTAEIARALLRAGVKRVEVWALARAM